MKTALILLSLLFACSMFTGCEQAKPPVNPEPTSTGVPVAATPKTPSHEGAWSATAAVMAGTPFPTEVVSSMSLKLADEEYETAVGGAIDKGICTVDTSLSPMQMTIVGADGPNKGKTFLAIFDFPNVDEMRVCYDMTGIAYPTVFESTAENGLYLATYSRKSE